MKRKLIAVLLAATMAVSLAGCGGGDAGTAGDSGSAGADSGAAGEEGGEPYTVTMVLNGTQQPDEERIEAKVNEILEKELNARLDLVVLPWASASQQLQLMLAGDEKIDIFYTNATSAVQYMHSGQIMDMAGLIDQYGTNLKGIFGEETLKGNSVGGFLYGVPVQIERGSIPAIFMRKDLADEKERAEHVMLVDLARNDMGRIARFGTVKVTEAVQEVLLTKVMAVIQRR